MASFGSAVGSPLKFLVALAATVLPGAADLQVPSAPTDALLEVVSGDSLALAWASPMTDGGAAVQSYQVEWDTNPGRAEVQTVTTSTYIGANELQTISTSARGVLCREARVPGPRARRSGPRRTSTRSRT